MFDPERLLRQMVGGTLGGSLGGGRRSRGGLAGGLGIGKAQIGLGLLGVAMAAYQHYGKSASAAPVAAAAVAPPPPPPPLAFSATPPPPPPAAKRPANAPTAAQPVLDLARQEAALLVRAMIAAAAADGRIDALERANIIGRAKEDGDNPETLAYLEFELAQPTTLEELIAQTPRSLAEPVYAASYLAITVDSEPERAYLDALALGLAISEEKRAALHAQLQPE
jgi:uncharacterized membrane protein YebE (DUF533 family)